MAGPRQGESCGIRAAFRPVLAACASSSSDKKGTNLQIVIFPFRFHARAFIVGHNSAGDDCTATSTPRGERNRSVAWGEETMPRYCFLGLSVVRTYCLIPEWDSRVTKTEMRERRSALHGRQRDIDRSYIAPEKTYDDLLRHSH